MLKRGREGDGEREREIRAQPSSDKQVEPGVLRETERESGRDQGWSEKHGRKKVQLRMNEL